MRNRIKEICMASMFVLIIVGFGIAFLLSPDKEISTSERRKLSTFPDISLASIQNGEWFEKFEDYSLDQFPLRDNFRTIKAAVEYGIFIKADNNDIYISNGYVCKMDYPLDEDAIVEACEKLNDIYDTLFEGADAYYSIIPDKNYFLADESGHLSYDYDVLFSLMDSNLDSQMKYVDIASELEIGQYYKTDLHWQQQSIIPVADHLLSEMKMASPERDYTFTTLSPFYGAYFGQAALPISPDELIYLSNSVLNNCTVYNPLKNTYSTIYETSSFSGVDPYDVFLSGAESILVIDPNNPQGDELYIFRDSFTSALSPLLIESCSKIVLIDPRYIAPENVAKYIELSENSKVLFMFSTTILNKGYLFK